VISKDPGFSDLTGVTEAYVPAAGVFVGEHPLLRRYYAYIHYYTPLSVPSYCGFTIASASIMR
jgi:hypothetical protein